jgi:hypothetical protein
MTPRFYILSLLIGVTLTFQRCTFEPHKEYVNPIAPPEPLSVTIQVNDPNFADPYYLIETTTFRFTLADLTKPVIDYVVKIDGNIVSEGTNNDIQFFLYPHSLNEGTHTVNMTIRVATKSGSLAEKLGAEYYLIEKNFRIINDRTLPPAVTPTAAYENGKLVIRWNTLSQKNFYYVIKRTYTPYNPLRDTIIRNTTQNFFIDNGYTGGQIEHKIAVTGFGFERQDLGSVMFNDDPIDFEITRGEGKTVRLVWNNSSIDVQNVELSIETDGRTIKQPLTTSGNVNIDTMVLGEERNYWIKTMRSGYGSQAFTRIKGLKLQQTLKQFKSHAMLVNQSKLLVLTSKAIYRYALPSIVLEDSLLSIDGTNFSAIAVSEDGERAVVLKDNWKLYEFNPMDFQASLNDLGLFAATIDVSGNGAIQEVKLGNISQNGLLSMVIRKNGNRRQVLFDIHTGLVPWFGDFFQYLNEMYPPVISSDGLYLSNDFPATGKGSIYKWNGTSFIHLATVAAGRKYFRAGNRELINGTIKDGFSSIAEGAVQIYDLTSPPLNNTQSLTLLRSINFPAIENDQYFWETGYDESTGIFYARYMIDATSILKLYNANTMATEGEETPFTFTPYSHVFQNNYHLTNRGFIETAR